MSTNKERTGRIIIKVEKNHKGRFLKQFDIIFADFGTGQGHEKQGKRPCIVLSNNIMNRSSSNIVVAPLTKYSNKIDKSGKAKILNTHVILSKKFYKQLPYTSIVQVEDIRSISKDRVVEWIGDLSGRDQELIHGAERFVLGL